MKKLAAIPLFIGFLFVFYFSGNSNTLNRSGFRDAPADFTDINIQNIKNQHINVPAPSPTKAGNSYRGNIRQIAIYGKNTLADYYKVNKSLQQMADSVVAFVSKNSLYLDPDENVYKAKKLETIGRDYNLERNEDFENQKHLSYCSGSLVADNLVLTAGHCIEYNPKNPIYYKNTYIVFGWKQYEKNKYNTSFSPNQVYKIKRILIRSLKRGNINSAQDYALIELNNPATDKDPLPIDRTGEFLAKGNKVFTIGYPMGMSVKITDPVDAQIYRIGKTKIFTDLDTFGGSSGSPVFDSYTKRIIGIHVTGRARNRSYATDRTLTVKFTTSNKMKTGVYFYKNKIKILITSNILEATLNQLKEEGAIVNSAAKTITILANSKIFNNYLSFDLAVKYNAIKLVSGKFVRYKSFDGIGSGETRINSIIEAFVPLTNDEKRICYAINEKMRASRPSIDPNLMMLYKMNKCDKNRGI